MKMKDLTNQKFGRLTAVKFAYRDHFNHARWLCVCECGNEKIIDGGSLTSGKTRSCGCLNIEQLHKKGFESNRAKHCLWGTRIYRIWKCIKTRCYNSNTKDYELYGGRGIKVCDEWKDSFPAFMKWSFENGYDNTKSIDRINVNGDYEPSNCRWATAKQQANNKRNNHFITIGEETKTVTEWIEVSGICKATFYQRLRAGKTGQDLISTPRPRKGVV